MAKIYSHSKIQSYEQCPLKYKYKYIDKFPPDIEKTVEAHLGSAVHDTLEWIYNSVQKGKSPPMIEEVIKYYQNKWEEKIKKEYENLIIGSREMTFHLSDKRFLELADIFLTSYNQLDKMIESYYKTINAWQEVKRKIKK